MHNESGLRVAFVNRVDLIEKEAHAPLHDMAQTVAPTPLLTHSRSTIHAVRTMVFGREGC